MIENEFNFKLKQLEDKIAKIETKRTHTRSNSTHKAKSVQNLKQKPKKVSPPKRISPPKRTPLKRKPIS